MMIKISERLRRIGIAITLTTVSAATIISFIKISDEIKTEKIDAFKKGFSSTEQEAMADTVARYNLTKDDLQNIIIKINEAKELLGYSKTVFKQLEIFEQTHKGDKAAIRKGSSRSTYNGRTGGASNDESLLEWMTIILRRLIEKEDGLKSINSAFVPKDLIRAIADTKADLERHINEYE